VIARATCTANTVTCSRTIVRQASQASWETPSTSGLIPWFASMLSSLWFLSLAYKGGKRSLLLLLLPHPHLTFSYILSLSLSLSLSTIQLNSARKRSLQLHIKARNSRRDQAVGFPKEYWPDKFSYISGKVGVKQACFVGVSVWSLMLYFVRTFDVELIKV
jgi:hypothetical protein